MRAFAELYRALDETTSTRAKVEAIASYLAKAPPADAAWAISFLIGRRPKRLVQTGLLRAWAAEAAGIPEWLFRECYDHVGDLAETIALLLPPGPGRSGAGNGSLEYWVTERLLTLRTATPEQQRVAMRAAWQELGEHERFVFNKLITGAFRVGAASRLVTRAIHMFSRVPEDVLSHRLMGHWEPGAEFYAGLLSADTSDADLNRPYPFYLAYALEHDALALGAPEAWAAEWKWDGIRSQLIRRAGAVNLWSRGDELLTGRFPEVETAAAFLPDGTVLDGELLAWRDGAPLPFSEMQRRIGLRKVSARLLGEVPVALIAFDLLEHGGVDIRRRPFSERRARLGDIVARLPTAAAILTSAPIDGDWEERARRRADARSGGAEGLMLKRLDSVYGVGRRKGDWWKWKVDPYSVDAVLLYAQPGHGRRAGLFTDYTFGVWRDDELVPFAKAYGGLTDVELRKVDAFVRRHTREKFGPVRVVEPVLVFEIAFEGIQRSTRHKSGIAVRFPRMARWRTDKGPREADTIESLLAMLPE